MAMLMLGAISAWSVVKREVLVPDQLPIGHPGLTGSGLELQRCPHLAPLYAVKSPLQAPSFLTSMGYAASSLMLQTWNYVFPQPNPHIPPVFTEPTCNGFQNLAKLQTMGPEAWVLHLVSGRTEGLLKTQVGTKWLYIATDAAVAKQLLGLGAEIVGRGRLFETFSVMIGREVFFSMDGSKVGPKRKLFKDAVNRTEENFEKMKSLASIAIAQVKKNDHPDGVGLVSRFVMGAIGACFVGMNDVDKIPVDAFTTFMKAGTQIIHGGVDALSAVTTPMARREFRAVKEDMEKIWTAVLTNYLDQICTCNNYVRDLAVMRLKELYPDMDVSASEKGYFAGDPNNAVIRDLIQNDKTVREDGPTTLFASMNITRSLYFMIEMLNQQKGAWQRICDELRPLLDLHRDGTYTLDDFHENVTSFSKAFIHECLFQLTPIPAMGREMLRNTTVDINGLGAPVHFRKGDVVLLSYRDLQRCGDEFKFNPEAWLEKDPTRDLWTFGQGSRSCPARPFAIQSMLIFLIEMVRQEARLVPAADISYTTEFGGIGPDYHRDNPIAMTVQA